jgi:predicted AAA+ superfamily ATPase
MIARRRLLSRIETLFRSHSVVALLGPRQVGKTTLARQFARRHRGLTTMFDLEDPRDHARLDDPMLALDQLSGVVILDEIQRRPELFPAIRVLADRPHPIHFLVLGSASPHLLRQSSETLAGRIAFIELEGFSLDEVGVSQLDRLWLRGGFPRSYLARSIRVSDGWRREFIRTFLERDLPQLGISLPAMTVRRFWAMLAHAHGQIWNASRFAASFGVADTTIRRYLDVLTSTFVIRQLQPWHENLRKRQVKAPKIYVIDSGLLHTLLDIVTRRDLERHPSLGASWEGFVMQMVLTRLAVRPEQCYFWATHAGAELDLLVTQGRKRFGFEIKRTSAPRITPSMRIALSDLKLQRLDVLHAGKQTFPLAHRIRALAVSRMLRDLQPFPA